MSRTVVIHQPEYFPWLGFLDKARQADVLVLLDSVQFDRSSLQHRAKIVGANGPLWLTMPYVHRFPQRIDEVELAADRWSVKHQKSVQACYGRAPAYKQVAPQLERVFSSVHKRLVDVTVPSCELLLDAFGVRPKELLRSSALDVKGDKGDLVIEIVKKLEDALPLGPNRRDLPRRRGARGGGHRARRPEFRAASVRDAHARRSTEGSVRARRVDAARRRRPKVLFARRMRWPA
ncbi:MAG: WbqC family protein [Polyangiaceae bacterium]|nr:WbqC family protein [Polyangiaceae bacterium]